MCTMAAASSVRIHHFEIEMGDSRIIFAIECQYLETVELKCTYFELFAVKKKLKVLERLQEFEMGEDDCDSDVPLLDRVRMFDKQANKHLGTQALNPFANDGKVGSMPKPKFSKEEYGRPPKGSLSESRALKATSHVCKEMLDLCEVINQNGERLYDIEEKPEDPRKVISFGELFQIYTAISDKVVGLLLRARKHHIVDFEGETLFQRRDDHVAIFLLKPIAEIRSTLHQKIDEATKTIHENGDF